MAEPPIDPHHVNQDTSDLPAVPQGHPKFPPMPRSFPRIEGYRLIRQKGKGGYGKVYEAIQIATGQSVAIKVLSGRHTENPGEILAEIQTLTRLDHPNIVDVKGAGQTEEGDVYFVMRLCDGAHLHDYVRARRLSLRATLELFVTICKAIAYIRDKGIAHRDLKPTNILVDTKVTIVDFGLAKRLALPDDSVDRLRLGTLAYMSPEQTRGIPEEVDFQTDVYSLGVTFYEILTGQLPYPYSHDWEMLERIRHCPPQPMREAWSPATGVRVQARAGVQPQCPIDRRLERIILRALEKERKDRYRDAGEMARDLENYLHGKPLDPPLRNFLDDGLILSYTGFARRHAVTHAALLITVACSLTGVLFVPLIFSTRINPLFEGLVVNRLFGGSGDGRMNSVRVIGRLDSTRYDELAEAKGVPGVIADKVETVRPLHGLLMTQLAASRCKAVVLDFAFAGEADGDKQFLDGVAVLREKEIDVVVSSGPWRLDDSIPRRLSEEMAKHLRTGSPIGTCEESGIFTLQLVAQRGQQDPRPSLALATLASALRPGEDYVIRLDSSREKLDLVFPKGDQEVRLTRLETVGVTEQEMSGVNNLDDGDRVGLFMIPRMPTDKELADSMFPYEEVLFWSEDRLLREFADKVVVVADLRSDSPDKTECPNDGPTVPGGYVIAAGIDALLDGSAIRLPRWWGERIIAAIGAAAGCFLGLLVPVGFRRRALVLGLFAVVFMAATLIAFKGYQYLFNPLFPAVAAWVGAEVTAALQRVSAGGPDPIS